MDIRKRWTDFMPRHGRLLGFVVVAVVAFSLGMVFSGGDDMSEPDGAENHVHDLVPSSEPTIWTCSMHPQIQLPKPGKCPICNMDLIPLETTTDDELGPRQLRLSETAKELDGYPDHSGGQSVCRRRRFAWSGKIDYDETRLRTSRPGFQADSTGSLWTTPG